jgi:hypothetical protein
MIQNSTEISDESGKDVIGAQEERDDKMVRCMIVSIY